MQPTTDNKSHAKKAVILALAQQNSEFAVFYEQYKDDIEPVAALPDDFIDEVLNVINKEPDLKPLADTYMEHAQTTAKYAIVGLPEASVIIAALFLLGSHIKIHKNTSGKWEFLFEHESKGDAAIEKIAEILTKLLKH